MNESFTGAVTILHELAQQNYRLVLLWGIIRNGRCACPQPDCRSAGKHPVSAGWQQRRPSLTEVERHLASGGNVGLATGGRLVVLDIDPRHGGDESLQELEQRYGPLPAETATVATGSGGLHYYFILPEECQDLPGRVGLKAGLDVRCKGNLVVLPPSLHVSGQRYTWHRPPSEGIATCPPWLVDLVAGRERGPRPLAFNEQGVIPEGRRHASLVSLAGTLRARGVPGDLIDAVLETLAERGIEGTMPPAEIAGIVEAAKGWPAPPPDHDLTHKRHAELAAEQLQDRLAYAEGLGWVRWSGQFWQRIRLGQAMVFVSNTLGELYQRLHEVTRDARWLKARLGVGSATTLSCILRLLEAMPGISVPAERFDCLPDKLPVLNGLLDIRSGTITEHRPQHFNTFVCPVEHDATATAPAWQRHLDLVLPDAALQRQLQRELGKALLGRHTDERFAIFYSRGGSGRSVTLRAVAELLGPLGWWAPGSLLAQGSAGRHPVELMELRGKRLVIVSEPAADERLDEGLLKRLVGGEPMTARALYQPPVTFPRSWHIVILTNNLPPIKDYSEGFWRRVSLLPWETQVPEQVQRPQAEVLAELERERSGILNWMIQGARDWLQDPHWQAPQVRAAVQTYRSREDALQAFLQEACVIAPQAFCERPQLVAAYQEWCQRNGERPLSSRQLYDRLRELGFLEAKRHGRRQWVGLGLRLAEE